MGSGERVLDCVEHRAECHVVQVRKQLVLPPEDVEVRDPPLCASEVLLQCGVVDVSKKGVGLDFARGHLPGELQPVQHLGAGCARVNSFFTGHGMQELQVAKVRAGHHVAVQTTLGHAAPNDRLGLRFLLRILEETVPTQRLCRESDGLGHVAGLAQVGAVTLFG